MRSKVAVIGAGMVGASFAYVLMVRGLVRELALVDSDPEKARGEAMDLSHGLSFVSPVSIEAGGYELCRDAAIVAVTAGAAQRPGETRLDLARKNAAITREVVARVLEHNPSPILLMVSNPVDVLTSVALKESGLPPGRVIGSGTVLDSARFRFQLSEHCGIDPRNIHAHIIGEHGDSEVAVWSRVNVGGISLADFCGQCGRVCSGMDRDKVMGQVRNAAYEIIKRKRATYYAIGLAMARIVEAVLKDQHSVLTVSSLVRDYYGIHDVCLSLPNVVGARGIEETIHSTLAEDEAEGLRRSAAVLRASLDSLDG